MRKLNIYALNDTQLLALNPASKRPIIEQIQKNSFHTMRTIDLDELWG